MKPESVDATAYKSHKKQHRSAAELLKAVVGAEFRVRTIGLSDWSACVDASAASIIKSLPEAFVSKQYQFQT